MPKILIPLANGFEEIEAVNMIDVLRRADIEVIIAGVGGKRVEGGHHIVIEAECLICDVDSDELDMIILPGGWGGTKVLAEDAQVQALLKEMDAKKKMIGAICAAPFALNKAGVLKPNYTCYPSVEKDIELEGYRQDKKVVVDQNVMTSRGPGTAICFALSVVQRFKGEQIAERLRKNMLVEPC